MKATIQRIISLLTIVVLIGCLFSACSKEITYTVVFDSMGGSSVESQIVKEGEVITKPNNPQKEGFTFIEWQLDGSTYDFNSAVTKDLILTAYYEIKEGTEIVLVMLDYQNGQAAGIVEIIKGGTMTEPPMPERQGYKFVGWFVDDIKYDFSSKINENITLIAKWNIDKTTTSTTSSNSNNNSAENEEPNNNSTTTITPSFNFSSIVQKYSGTWYLDGYSDVFIKVYETTADTTLQIDAINFALPLQQNLANSPVDAYTIYPYKNFLDMPSQDYWSTGFELLNDSSSWNDSLTKNKLVFGNNCIYINNNKFVKTKGQKDQYYDTCYRDAIGVWYLSNTPNSTLDIHMETDYGLPCGHYFTIIASDFDFATLNTNKSSVVGGWAGRKNNWEQYGISVNNDVLTVTNKNGTRTFYKTKTYQKVSGVSLDTKDVELSIGKTKTLKATVSPSNAYDKSVTWSSSNSSVATVSSSGVVTAKGEGTTTISVKTKDGNYTATCKVTVSVIHVSGISLNKTSLNMTIGGTQQLSATIAPSNAENKAVTWSSNNESVAQVSSNGKITAKSKGTAIITVKSADGGYSATCEVTVSEPKLTVTASIGVGYYMSDSASVRGVFAEVKPSGGSGDYVEYAIKLYYNGTLVAESSKDEVIVTPVKNGTYTAEVYVKDSSGNEATVTKTTTISY